MEPASWIIIILLVFGGHEHIQKKEARAEIIELKAELSEAHEETKEAVEVNDLNAITIREINQSNSQCFATLEKIELAKNRFAAANESSQTRIEELEILIDSYEWSDVRIPSELLDGVWSD